MECWSDGVLELCTLIELHPASAGLKTLSGRSWVSSHPGLKPQAEPWCLRPQRFA
jgi:hypothetical protein